MWKLKCYIFDEWEKLTRSSWKRYCGTRWWTTPGVFRCGSWNTIDKGVHEEACVVCTVEPRVRRCSHSRCGGWAMTRVASACCVHLQVWGKSGLVKAVDCLPLVIAHHLRQHPAPPTSLPFPSPAVVVLCPACFCSASCYAELLMSHWLLVDVYYLYNFFHELSFWIFLNSSEPFSRIFLLNLSEPTTLQTTQTWCCWTGRVLSKFILALN